MGISGQIKAGINIEIWYLKQYKFTVQKLLTLNSKQLQTCTFEFVDKIKNIVKIPFYLFGTNVSVFNTRHVFNHRINNVVTGQTQFLLWMTIDLMVFF